ncbi:MAG: deoxynucleoside kinase [Candidatus Rokubacteria bacterium]|nr:deoxynucleoside kinase [Candidatus Rokubacteria bacterium]
MAPRPAVVISLEASVPTLLHRIRQRARPYEQDKATHLETLLYRLEELYRHWIRDYSDSYVVAINTEEEDTRDVSVRRRVLAQVREAIAGHAP